MRKVTDVAPGVATLFLLLAAGAVLLFGIKKPGRVAEEAWKSIKEL